jgi:hypothetical protein
MVLKGGGSGGIEAKEGRNRENKNR